MPGNADWEGEDQPVEVVPYDPAWPGRFERERDLLRRTIGPLVDGGIHHVGSTAVPGLAAKPVIDVMVGVRSLDEARRSFDPLAEIGYCYWPHRPWMHWFCKPSPAERTHHLHLIEADHPQFAARLAFRDHLRGHPAATDAYAALKFELAARYRDDRDGYTEAKADFVRLVLERALEDSPGPADALCEPDPLPELIEERFQVAEHELVLLRPPDPEALLDEAAFEHEEFLPYWAELWPSGLALAEELARRRPAGSRVLELGCGLAVPSIVAALEGADVLATDWSPDAIAVLPRNAGRNGARLRSALVDWAEPARLLAGAPWDLVVGSDLLYERRNLPLLLGLLPRLVDGGEVLLADPGRPALAGFLETAARSFEVESAPGRVTLYRLRRLAPGSHG